MATEQDLRRENLELKAELAALQAQLDGNIPQATYWLQRKVSQQRVALDILQNRIVSQRFRLSLLNELGRDVTREEWELAKKNLDADRHRRVGDYVPLSA